MWLRLRGDVIWSQPSCDDLTQRFQQEIVEIDVHMFLTQLVLTGTTPNVHTGGRLCPKRRSRKKGTVVGFFERYDMDFATWHSGPKSGRNHTTIRRSEQQWWSALFQILHGLRAIHQLKIMHGDHHDENILVRRVPRDTCIVYRDVGGKPIRVPTHGYVFATYDFGNASARRSDSLRNAYVRYGDDGKKPRAVAPLPPGLRHRETVLLARHRRDREPGHDGRVPRVQRFLERVIDSNDSHGPTVESQVSMRRLRSFFEARAPDNDFHELDHVNQRRSVRRTPTLLIGSPPTRILLLRGHEDPPVGAGQRARVLPTRRPLVPVRPRRYTGPSRSGATKRRRSARHHAQVDEAAMAAAKEPMMVGRINTNTVPLSLSGRIDRPPGVHVRPAESVAHVQTPRHEHEATAASAAAAPSGHVLPCHRTRRSMIRVWETLNTMSDTLSR